jgi:hypothetical protein
VDTLIRPYHTFTEDILMLVIASDTNRHPSRSFWSAVEAYSASKGLSRLASLSFVQEKNPMFGIVNLYPPL